MFYLSYQIFPICLTYISHIEQTNKFFYIYKSFFIKKKKKTIILVKIETCSKHSNVYVSIALQDHHI